MMTRRRPPAPGAGLIQPGAAPHLGAHTWEGAPVIARVEPQTPRVVARLHSAIDAGVGSPDQRRR